MRSISHWAPRYIFNRLGLAFFELTHSDAPWLNRSTINLLDSWLKPSDIGFEWDSGRSTLWFSFKVQQLTTIEHNPDWYTRVSQEQRSHGRSNVVVKLGSLNEDHSTVAVPYINAITSVEDNSLDFVLVDGKQRA